MGKDKDKKKDKKEKKLKKEQKASRSRAASQTAAPSGDGSTPVEEGPHKISKKEFEKEMEKLQVELVKLQEWVKATGAKICVMFEGRDTAGKGGVIKRITERVSPRVFRVVALGHAHGAGEIADVLPALHAPSAGSRGSGALRPQLVQPGRRRAGDGLCHPGTGGLLPEIYASGRAADHPFRHHPDQVLAGSGHG